MRQYPENSPEAAARVIALALLADGSVHPDEVTLLIDSEPLRRMGVSQDVFRRVTAEFCQDVARGPHSEDRHYFALRPLAIRHLLDEITDPVLQGEISQLVFEVIRADRQYQEGESLVLRALISAWSHTNEAEEANPFRLRRDDTGRRSAPRCIR